MSQYIRASRWPAALVLAVTLAACGGDRPADDTLAQDSALTRDLEMVGGDTALQPQLEDVPPVVAETPPAKAPATKAPAAKRPQPTRPATPPVAATPPRDTTVTSSGNTVTAGPGSAERTATIAAGSMLSLDAADKVCTNTNRIGDRFVATLKSPVAGTNGGQIPAGAAVTIELTELKRSENANDQIRMGFRVVNIAFDGRTYPLDADVQTAEITRVRSSSGGDDAKKVIGGAVAGAVIGQILGKRSKSTIIGAAAGAAAGGAAAAATGNYEGCVNAGGDISVKLNSSLVLATR